MDFKMDVEKKLKQIPHVGDSVARSVKKSKDSIRQLFVKGGFLRISVLSISDRLTGMILKRWCVY